MVGDRSGKSNKTGLNSALLIDRVKGWCPPIRPCQGRGRGFEPLRPLQRSSKTEKFDEGPLRQRAFRFLETACLKSHGFDFQTACPRDGDSAPLPATRKGAWREGSLSSTASRSRRMRFCARYSFIPALFELRAQGMPGARCAPRSRVQDGVESAHEHTGHTGITRHSPRSGFNGYFVLSPVRRAFWPPSPAFLNADLTPASGCQDHTTLHVRFKRRRLRHHPRPPHPAPRFVTLRNAPLWERTAVNIEVIWIFGKTESTRKPCGKMTRRADHFVVTPQRALVTIISMDPFIATPLKGL
jgi:hypothetical protein